MYDNDNYNFGNNNTDSASSGFGNQQGTSNKNDEYSGYSTYQYDNTQQTQIQQPPKSGVMQKILLSISLGLFFGLFAGLGFYAVQQGTGLLNKQNDAPVVNTPVISETDTKEESQGGIKLTNTDNIMVVESDVSDVVEEVMPAMVSIINNYTVTGEFWGQTYSQDEASSGSGIIVAETDTELLIVSNNHVVEGTDRLMVTFIDGSEAEAHIKGLDSDMDLAVIAVALDALSSGTRENISIATLGDSDSLKLGTPVIAIGNALGYGQSVTTGIVSALDREIEFEDGTTGSFIQTDAAINPGNSGGALLNVNGEVIGINSSKIGGSVVEGMGYAIPITSASPIISDLMERQTRTDKVAEADKGYLGISLQEVTYQISQMYNMPEGIYVVSVEEGSGAKTAGVIPGDIITHFDGSRVTSYAELQNLLQYYAAGTDTEITVMRPEGGQYVQYNLDITLGSRPVNK